MSPEKIPTIDYRAVPYKDFVDAFGDAFKTYGFAVITNHGIDPALFRKMYISMVHAFDLPVHEKQACENRDHTTGYVPYGTEKAKDSDTPDEKEFWEVRLRGTYAAGMKFPSAVPGLEKSARELFEALDRLSMQLLNALSWYLDLKPGQLSGMAKGGDTLMRLLHYPSLDQDARGLRSAPHEDINLITLLISATAPGLQVKSKSGEWIEVTNPPEDIIVNAGDMLQAFTENLGRKIPSTTHQVVNLPGERFSIPFFVHPRDEVVLRPGLTAGVYLDQRLHEIGLKK